METLVMPYRVFMLQRVQYAADALDARLQGQRGVCEGQALKG